MERTKILTGISVIGLIILVASLIRCGGKDKDLPTTLPKQLDTSKQVDSLLRHIDLMSVEHLMKYDSMVMVLNRETDKRKVYEDRIREIDRMLSNHKRSLEETPENIQKNIEFIKAILKQGEL